MTITEILRGRAVYLDSQNFCHPGVGGAHL